jgi:nucleotide-binding universal stress UspA family protein
MSVTDGPGDGRRGPVVAGIDDDPEQSSAVLRWAGVEASGRGLTLRIVHAHSWPGASFVGARPPLRSELAWQDDQATADGVVAAAVEQVREHHPGLVVSGAAIEGRPVQVLVREAEAAELLVIGSRALNPFAAYLVGSVGLQLVRHAACPVLVVRPGLTEPDASGPVTVALNIEDPSPAAFDVAMAEARNRGIGLDVIGYARPTAVFSQAREALLADPDAQATRLAELLRRWHAPTSGVAVRILLCTDRPAAELVRVSSGCTLIVVDRDGTGAAFGSAFGAVSAALLRHASCPVIVVGAAPEALAADPAPAQQRAADESVVATPAVPIGGVLPIVVGISGSRDTDEAALQWAAAEAQRRAKPITLVGAWEWGITRATPAASDREPVIGLADLREAASAAVSAAADQLRALDPALVISERVVQAYPSDALLTEHASVIVLGSRRLGPLSSFLLASVGTDLIHRAHCPVVVTRGPGRLEGEPGQLVVGVDGGPGSAVLLEFAFAEASLRRRALSVILVLNAPSRGARRRLVGADEQFQQARVQLAEAMAGRSADHPDVAVHTAVVKGHPATVLLEQSDGQEMLIVGCRTASPVSGSLPGAVTHNVLHHANCPVAVVPLRSVRS